MRSLGEDMETVRTIVDHFSDKLSVWETEFIESIEERLSGSANPLTEKQGEALDRIFEKVSGGGRSGGRPKW